MVPVADNAVVKEEDSSPNSVIDHETNKAKIDGDILLSLDAKNEDISLISRTMVKEEVELLETRLKEEEVENVNELPDPHLDDTQFSKLDELLNQTQVYSEFLLEKMEDITANGVEDKNNETDTRKKGGRVSKRKAAAQHNNRRAKRAVAAMLSRSQEGAACEDVDLTEEEKAEKEQAELAPLLTGGKLKPYQVKGMKWLISLWQNGLNGILADQMGLGKTIQTIAFLAHLKGKGLDGPYLVIAPLSTVSNWVNEISRFTPSLKAIIYHGDKKVRAELRRKYMPRTVGPSFPIVVTTYEIAMADARPTLCRYNWKYVVVDEGHRLKNSNCKLRRELNYMPVENKLLLTGTPLQNNLAELWSLLNFILPDIFSSHAEFESWFDLSGKCSNEALEEKRRKDVVLKLHAILRPFLLRRMKKDVEQMLPKKKEIILYATMTEYQKNYQDHLINRTLEDYLAVKASERSGTKAIIRKLNNVVIQLRKNCAHPDLLDSEMKTSYLYPPINEMVEQCGKLRLLDKLLPRLFADKHKVLIFSQWTKVLDILDYYLSERNIKSCRFDGSTNLNDRREQIKAFDDVDNNCDVFLLTTRAGGLGINLTAADTCIIYDSDWNPQMDLQAMDRCHRIGQTRPVHVYRLVTAHSVEGHILRRAFNKLKLEHVVIVKGRFEQERQSGNVLDEEDLVAFLQPQEDEEDKMVQTDINDEDLTRVLDRSDMEAPLKGDGDDNHVESTPLKGPGWEVVVPTTAGSMLSNING